MLTLVKWIANDNTHSSNALITRTLGKLGALHRESVYKMHRKPRAGEWWYSEVVKETGAGTERGLWVLRPTKLVPRIERDGFRDYNITYLFPNIFTKQRFGNVLLLSPKYKGPNWICANSLRSHLIRRQRRAGIYSINSVVIVFDDNYEWIKEYVAGRIPDTQED